MERIRCTNCDYDCNYSRNLYKYNCINDEILKPEIEKGFCLDCNAFVDIQKGLDISDVLKNIKTLNSELEEWNGIWFKTRSQKERVRELKDNIEGLQLIAQMNNFKSSVPVCLNCNHSNIISKDVDKSVWVCPKCGKGRLYIHTEESSVRFRIIPKPIYPVVNSRRFRTGVFIYRCAYDIVLSDLYILKDNNINITPTNDNFGVLFEAVAFVYSYLGLVIRWQIEYQEKQIIEDLWLLLGKTSGMKELEFKSNFVSNNKYYRNCIKSQKLHERNTYHEMMQNILFSKSYKSSNTILIDEIKLIPDDVINQCFKNMDSMIRQYFKYS